MTVLGISFLSVPNHRNNVSLFIDHLIRKEPKPLFCKPKCFLRPFFLVYKVLLEFHFLLSFKYRLESSEMNNKIYSSQSQLMSQSQEDGILCQIKFDICLLYRNRCRQDSEIYSSPRDWRLLTIMTDQLMTHIPETQRTSLYLGDVH